MVPGVQVCLSGKSGKRGGVSAAGIWNQEDLAMTGFSHLLSVSDVTAREMTPSEKGSG